ncbi:hypothetical protein [Ornithobacterium rhinotracheale]|uniref:hypothetical protein n=1 Tax=Ornithobacterium rhinotracheale TaxID=28251 RepID=UPI004039FED3
MPSAALYISSVVMTIFMILVVTAKNVYDAAIDITGVIILPSYLFSSMFLWKSAQNKTVFKDNSKRRNLGLFVGICSTIYCLWLLYAGGLDYLLITSVIYAIGIIFFWYARKEQKLNEPIFKSYEKWLAIILVILAIISIILIIMGKVKF